MIMEEILKIFEGNNHSKAWGSSNVMSIIELIVQRVVSFGFLKVLENSCECSKISFIVDNTLARSRHLTTSF